MKKNLLYVLACTFALLLFNAESQAQTKKLIHYWHFNNTVNNTHYVSIPADYSTLGNASVIYKPVKVAGASDTTNINDYMDNYKAVTADYDTINSRPGYGGCCGGTNYAIRTRNPSDYMQFLWYIPTNKYENIVVRYGTQSSSTASGQHRQVFSYSIDSALTFTTAGLPIAYDSAGLVFGKVTIDLTSLPAVNNNGKLVFKIIFTAPNSGTSGNNRFDNITVEGDTIIKPEFTSSALATGIINRPYSYTLEATGTPAPSFSVSGNPAWLTLTGNVLSGTPPSINTFGPITITASNLAGSDQQVFNLEIKDSINPVAPTITSTAPATGTVGSLYTYMVTSTGVPRPTISVTGNPSWLTLTDSTLSGTPPLNGIFGPITVTATNIVGNNQQVFSIMVPSAPVITSTAITNVIVDSLYSYIIAVSGTPEPALSVSGNPAWMTLSGDTLSGLAPSVGSFGPITIIATNEGGSNQQVFNVLTASIPQITSTAITTGTAGSLYTYNITATGAPAPVISVNGNPVWLSIEGSTLSGTPASSGFIGPITVTATNIASSVTQVFYLNVANPEVNMSASRLIYYWHFNNTLPADGSGGIAFGPHPIAPDYSAQGSGSAAIIYEPLPGVVSDTGYIDNYVGDTINQRQGYAGCCDEANNAVRTRNPSDSMQFLWYLPTTSYKNIVIKYETQLSSLKSGQHEQVFSYSLDSASTFITDGLPVVSDFADTIWEKVTLDLRPVTSINNNSKFVFRINFSAPNTGNKGNNRFDNITVEGNFFDDINVVPEIEKAYYSLYPNPANDHIYLLTASDGEKTVSIYNSTGVEVSSYNLSGKEMLINIVNLSPGFYFVKIVENGDKDVSMLKFIKE